MGIKFIIPALIPVAILALVVVLRVSGSRKLARMRELTCPDCHAAFVVPSLTAVRRWMDFDVDSGASRRSGITLRCERCAADYRFTEQLQFVGREAERSSV
jgi:hypothetical protein